MKLRKKAVASTVYMIIIGFLLFLMVSCAVGNGLIKAFKSYKGADDSANSLSEAMKEMSAPGSTLKLKLVGMTLEDGVAIYIFNGNSDLVEYVNDGSNTKRVIERPTECSGNAAAACLCLCKGTSLEESPNKDALTAKYVLSNSKYAYSLKCDKEIKCEFLDNVIYENRVQLSWIVTPAEENRIENGKNFVNIWEGGFSIWRFESKNEHYMHDQFSGIRLLDVYVVKMFGNKIKICTDYECYTNI